MELAYNKLVMENEKGKKIIINLNKLTKALNKLTYNTYYFSEDNFNILQPLRAARAAADLEAAAAACGVSKRFENFDLKEGLYYAAKALGKHRAVEAAKFIIVYNLLGKLINLEKNKKEVRGIAAAMATLPSPNLSAKIVESEIHRAIKEYKKYSL